MSLVLPSGTLSLPTPWSGHSPPFLSPRFVFPFHFSTPSLSWLLCVFHSFLLLLTLTLSPPPFPFLPPPPTSTLPILSFGDVSLSRRRPRPCRRRLPCFPWRSDEPGEDLRRSPRRSQCPRSYESASANPPDDQRREGHLASLLCSSLVFFFDEFSSSRSFWNPRSIHTSRTYTRPCYFKKREWGSASPRCVCA